jgi:tripartite-type tricarboxylate transporter receptor subunit TctC
MRRLVLLFSILAAAAASAQNYPSRPIRIVTTPAGGSLDLEARLIAQGISGPLGQQVIVDNRPGNIMGELVAKAPPDGYTLIDGGNDFLMGPLLRPAAYDPIKDFVAITITVKKAPNILVVHPSLPVKSVSDLITLAKSHPGELNYSYAGQGGGLQLAGELFKSMGKLNIQSVNYKGAAAALDALVSGEVQVMFADATAITPFAKSGKLRALAVTSAEPSPLYPGLPPIAEAGMPGYERAGFDGIWAPAGTPTAIVTRLNQEIVRLLKTADAKEKLFNVGAEAYGTTPEEADSRVKAEMVRSTKLIKDAGIRVN